MIASYSAKVQSTGIYLMFLNRKRKAKRICYSLHRTTQTVTESQADWGGQGPPGPSGPPLPQQGHVQAALGDLQGDPMDSLTTCARAQPPAQHGRASWCPDRTSWAPAGAHSLLSRHWAALKTAWLHLIESSQTGGEGCSPANTFSKSLIHQYLKDE